MKKKHMKVSFDQFVTFLKAQFEHAETVDHASVLDDPDEEYVVDFGSGPKLETSPTSSLIRSWQSLCGEDESI